MLILLSPSKSQDFSITAPTDEGHKPLFPNKTESIIDSLTAYSKSQISSLMKISDKLTDSTYTSIHSWNKPSVSQTKQAIFAYTGDVYKALNSLTYTPKNYTYMEKYIRILSGLYGCTTPLTFIEPYRLEMGTKLPISTKSHHYPNLYEFWSTTLNDYISNNFSNTTPIINLASNEYSKVLHLKQYGTRVIHIHFKSLKNGFLVTIGLIAKRQRGRLAHWLITNSITSPARIKEYSNDGFTFNAELSDPNQYIFTQNA